MEQYLIDEYDVFEDENYLKIEEEIKDYFMDGGREFFDCGQGYCQEQAEVTCKVGDKFYNVIINAEVGSAKQDIGDRLYWIEDISNVLYEEIEKPQPRERVDITYNLNITKSQKYSLERFMKENKMVFK
ncbi:hypothetical protein [Paenibacillus sp. FSL H3-0333]|uniref:hypothetical protein n=1 Tax=Paenibacillus sp. FSL H3-0333 TaxID=2921373 RepID=UPI0030F5B14F